MPNLSLMESNRQRILGKVSVPLLEYYMWNVNYGQFCVPVELYIYVIYKMHYMYIHCTCRADVPLSLHSFVDCCRAWTLWVSEGWSEAGRSTESTQFNSWYLVLNPVILRNESTLLLLLEWSVLLLRCSVESWRIILPWILLLKQ